MTFGTELNKISGERMVLRFVGIKTESVIFYLLVQNVVHELSAFRTIDRGMSFMLRICTLYFRYIDNIKKIPRPYKRFVSYNDHSCTRLCTAQTATPWI